MAEDSDNEESPVGDSCSNVSSSIFESPQLLIGTDSEGKVEVIESASEQVKSITKNMVVVAIVGMYRSGKSYLLNRLAGSNSGKTFSFQQFYQFLEHFLLNIARYISIVINDEENYYLILSLIGTNLISNFKSDEARNHVTSAQKPFNIIKRGLWQSTQICVKYLPMPVLNIRSY